MEIEQTRKNLMQAQEVHFKYLSSQRMAHTKTSMRRRVMDGGKSVFQPQPSTLEAQKTLQFGKAIKKIKKGEKVKMQRYRPGT